MELERFKRYDALLLNFQFIDHLGRDALEITDDQGNTLFHYAVGCLDDSAILKLMEKGAALMRRNSAEITLDEDEDDDYLFESMVTC
jgi:hypothetical protein